MKTRLLMAAIFSSAVLMAQTQEKKAVVHIKKVENINGVERVIDTTYTIDNPESLKWEEEIKLPEGVQINPGDSKTMKVIVNKEGDGDEDIKIITGDSSLNKEIEKAMQEAGVQSGSGQSKVIVINKSEEHDTGNGQNKISKVVIIRSNCEDATQEDLNRLGIKKSSLGEVIEANNMQMFPNPNDGKFNLKFTVKGKGNTEINIYNTEGKSVYSEMLPAFTGEYNKAIDLSSKEKGTYFVRVTQGKSTQVKKIVVGQ